MNALGTGCIDAILQDGDGGCHCFYEDTKDFARIELEALRATAAEVTALRQTVEEARRLLIDITDVFGHDSSIDAWLAAHSAPEVTP